MYLVACFSIGNYITILEKSDYKKNIYIILGTILYVVLGSLMDRVGYGIDTCHIFFEITEKTIHPHSINQLSRFRLLTLRPHHG